MKILLPLLTLGLAPGSFAQHFDPKPAGSLVRIAFDGPAKMAEAFAGTNFHDLLTSKEFGDAWAPVTQAIQQGIEAMKGQAPFDPQAVYDATLRYAGRVEMTVGFELEDEEPKVWVALALGGDGHTDLPGACKEVERLALDSGAPFTERSIGGHKWLTQHLGSEGFVTLPRMVGERVVVLGGTDNADAALATFFPSQAPADTRRETPIALTVDVGAALDLIERAVDIENGEGKVFADVMDAVGFGNVEELWVDIGRARRFLDMSMAVTSSGPRQGFLAMIMPNDARLPATGRLVQQSPSWSVAPIDLGILMPMLEKVMSVVPDAPMTLADIEAAAVENIGVRLREDLLAHLGGAILTAADDTVPEDGSDLGALTSTCFGLELKDGVAFGRSVETMLERAGVLEMRKSEKYRDTDVHRVTLPAVGIKLHWAITDRLFLLGIGDGGRARLGEILDAAAAAARGETAPSLPKAVRDRLEVVPQGYGGLGAARFGAVFFDAAVAGLRQAVAEGELDFDIDGVMEVLETLRGLFVKHDLGHAVSVTHYDPQRMVTRTIW